MLMSLKQSIKYCESVGMIEASKAASNEILGTIALLSFFCGIIFSLLIYFTLKNEILKGKF